MDTLPKPAPTSPPSLYFSQKHLVLLTFLRPPSTPLSATIPGPGLLRPPQPPSGSPQDVLDPGDGLLQGGAL